MLTLLLIIAAVVAKSFAADQCAVSDSDKVDCGFVGVQQSDCENKGCCWSPAGEGSSVPWCFYKSGVQQETCYGFQVKLL